MSAIPTSRMCVDCGRGTPSAANALCRDCEFCYRRYGRNPRFSAPTPLSLNREPGATNAEVPQDT